MNKKNRNLMAMEKQCEFEEENTVFLFNKPIESGFNH